MSNTYPVPEFFKQRAHLDAADYDKVYRESIENNEAFWAETARRIDWFKFPTQIKDVSFDKEDLHIKWYEDGVLNACYNCIDRHLDSRGDQVATWVFDLESRTLQPMDEEAAWLTEFHQEAADEPADAGADPSGDAAPTAQVVSLAAKDRGSDPEGSRHPAFRKQQGASAAPADEESAESGAEDDANFRIYKAFPLRKSREAASCF